VESFDWNILHVDSSNNLNSGISTGKRRPSPKNLYVQWSIFHNSCCVSNNQTALTWSKILSKIFIIINRPLRFAKPILEVFPPTPTGRDVYLELSCYEFRLSVHPHKCRQTKYWTIWNVNLIFSIWLDCLIKMQFIKLSTTQWDRNGAEWRHKYPRVGRG
jgi:hypothetical protein